MNSREPMRRIEISSASKTLAEYARQLDDDFLVLTSEDKPVAALVSLKNIDLESLALSTNLEFLEIIELARRECAAGQTIPLSAMKDDFGV